MELYHFIWSCVREHSVWICVALTLIALDIVFGFAGAVKHASLSSNKMRDGMWKKVGSIGLLVVSSVIDGAILGEIDLGFPPSLIAVCAYISGMEIISIMENLVLLNPSLADNPLISKVASKE